MDRAQAHLWKRRLFEAEAGLTRWLVDDHHGAHFDEWLDAQETIFEKLPAEDDAEGWRRVFFKAQAIMERFVVLRYGEDELLAWTRASAHVFGRTAPDYGPGAVGLATRLARQADGYSSDYAVEGGSERASITISHCAIWDYRERARRDGVQLTLKSPCTYCTKLTSANVASKGYQAVWDLREGPDGHGCRWDIR